MKGVKEHAERKRVENLERALREERTGLVAIAAAALKECPDPSRLMERLNAMAHAAGAVRKPGRQYEAIIYGRDVFARAYEQHIMKPQGLFDPDVGHVKSKDVDTLTANGDVQLSLLEPQAQRESLLAARRVLQEQIVEVLRRSGPRDDRSIWGALEKPGLTFYEYHTLRAELSRRGRIVKAAAAAPNIPGPSLWTLPEMREVV